MSPKIMKKIYVLLLATISVTVYAQPRVVLDSYFNDEHMKDASGKLISYHYKWEEKDNNGFSIFGDAFKNNGAEITTLYQEPSSQNLKQADIYIIVDPDTKKESPDPKYIFPNNVKVIANWVKHGGVLLLMANDSANVELPHFNRLAAKFGIHFNNDLRNHVKDDKHFNDGAFIIGPDNLVLKTAKKIYMKDICSLTLSSPAYPVLKDGDAPVIAVAHYGKGIVIAVGDPWLYNEYTNGRLPADFENDKAANDLAKWLIAQVKLSEHDSHD
jgi:unsaturated rhamnogalacturonyl hydrolase